MPHLPDIGKALIGLGVVLIAVGGAMMLPLKVPLIGRLPGDIFIKKEGFVLYIPITSSILVGMIVSLILRIFRR